MRADSLIRAIWQEFNPAEEREAVKELVDEIRAFYYVAETEGELRELALKHTDLVEPTSEVGA